MDYPKSLAVALRLIADKFADRAGAVPGSVIPAAAWANPVTDELIGLQTAAGVAAVEGDNTQVALAAQILARGGALGFRVEPQNPATLSVDIEAGAFFSRDTGLLVSPAATNAGPISAPGANPRNDIVYIDALTGVPGIETGTEAAAPVDPALLAGKLPLTRINAYVGMANIVAADLDDIRYLQSLGTAAGLGIILQTKITVDALARTTTSVVYVDSGVSVTITPRSINNKIRIRCHAMVGNSGASVVSLQARRNTVDISPAGAEAHAAGTVENLNGSLMLNFELEDSPATTAAVTYRLYWRTFANTAWLARRGSQVTVLAPTTLVAEEIAV